MKDIFKLQSEGINLSSKIMVLDLGGTGADVYLLGYAACLVNTKQPKHKALKFIPFIKEEDLGAFFKDRDGNKIERKITPLEEQKEHRREELRNRYKEDRRKEPIERVDLMQTLYVRWLEDQLIKE